MAEPLDQTHVRLAPKPDLQGPNEHWPPVVVASVFQTGLNLIRDLIRRGVRTVGVDYISDHEGFRSVYGKSYLCPDPDLHPDEWLAFMKSLSKELGLKPVIIPAADEFVTALGRHADALQDYYIFSRTAVSVQAALATKEQQYELARVHGLPCPHTAYVLSHEGLQNFLASAQFPCLLKPRHQREWDSLPEGNPLRGKKVSLTNDTVDMVRTYSLVAPYRPEAIAQEVIVGPDNAKYCYLSVYGSDGERLAYCVVREFRCNPMLFGSASVVEPVVDDEIQSLCDSFLRRIHYIGLCEIEVKRDSRDGKVRLIEVNPRFSGTGDCSIYTGIEVGWLHYLDLIGKPVSPVEPTRFNFRHVTLRRDLIAFPVYLAAKLTGWRQWFRAYRAPVEFFDFDLRDWRVTFRTVLVSTRALVGGILRYWKSRMKLRDAYPWQRLVRSSKRAPSLPRRR